MAAKKVDYSSETSVTEALRSQDAVVSILASAAVRGQRLIIDAAVAAGVKRFIPSEFGINTRALGDSPISKILGGKTASVNYLIEKSKEDPGFTWTGLSTGLFFDFVSLTPCNLARWTPHATLLGEDGMVDPLECRSVPRCPTAS